VVPQSVTVPLTSAAIFLVVAVNPDLEHHATVRSFCGELAKLVRAVGFRDLDGGLSCIMGFGSDAWDRLFGSDRPAELHTFREIRAGTRHAVATPGDLLFHIRAQRMDLCFELATQIMAHLAGAVSPLDEVHGFRYFDARDLLGFVDGTENPVGQAAVDAVLIGTEDAEFAGGSYVIVQKYLHDLAAWNALSTEAQERIIGRTKLSDHRTRRCGQAKLGAQRAHHDRGEWQGDQDSPRQHALWPRVAGRFWYLLYRLQPLAPDPRADA
jgi:putative iron-dependent peroxidase